MKKWIIVGIVVVVVLVGLGFFLMKGDDSKSNDTASSTNNSSTSNTSQNANENANNTTTPVAATITYTNAGFSPSTTTVKSGDTIAIKNDSSRDIQFDSDPHPDHTDDPELNVGIVSPGETKTFTVTTTGTHGIHNHLNPSDTATIIVQ